MTDQTLSQQMQDRYEAIPTEAQDEGYQSLQVRALYLNTRNAFDGMERITDNTDYTFDKRQSVLDEAINNARSANSRDYQDAIALLQDQLKKAESSVAITDTVSSEDAITLSYLRDSLKSQWEFMSLEEMSQDWRVALAHGDKHKARVYRDFSQRYFISKQPVNESTGQAPTLSATYNSFAKQSADLLMSDEMKQAHRQIATLKKTITKLNMANSELNSLFDSLHITENGLAGQDPKRLEMRQAIQARF